MATKGKHAPGVRIIGGHWRGRRLPVPDIPGLRPSGDRSRETLFNWLQAHLYQAVVADLFAGSGVLGIEAASRGAAGVTLIEQSPAACLSIENSLAKLGAVQVELVRGDALDWLMSAAPPLDLVFVDPPFGQGLEEKAVQLLDRRNLLSPGGIVYIETNRDDPPPVLPQGWSLFREKTIGDVTLRLFRKN